MKAFECDDIILAQQDAERERKTNSNHEEIDVIDCFLGCSKKIN